METAGKLVCITVTKGKCLAFDRTPWCKNTSSLHMNNAQRFLKKLHTSVQLLTKSLVTQDRLLTLKQYINLLQFVRLFTIVFYNLFDTGVFFLHATADFVDTIDPTLTGPNYVSFQPSTCSMPPLEQNLRPIT